jgi:methyl-accepting chemotaxis protein
MVLANVRLPQKLMLLVAVAAVGFAGLCALGLRALGVMQAEAVAALQRQGGAEAERFAQSAASSSQALLLAGVVLAVASLLVISLLAVWAQRGIVVPVRNAALAARRIADGDLTTEVLVVGRGEVSKMLRSLAQMTEYLRALVGEVASAARSVADSSTQIAQGNLDLSQRTEEQASTLEETSSSLEELTSTVARNADHARQAAGLANGASEVAGRGGRAVDELVSTMGAISSASRRIEEIIGVIDGIAFQTNILALNAAVEAARAGEQGRGFAVVAAEVRTLAQRSAAASREIKALIGDSTQQVEDGARRADAAGQTMREVVQAVAQVAALIAEIASASTEQTAGIGQVGTAVAQMDLVVQQNASLVEESAAAAESMKEQATALVRSVSRFRLPAMHAGRDDPRLRG